MNLILIAAPAAGKGTIAQLLHEKYGLIGVSAGELLRGVDPNTEIGASIREIQSKGLLVSNEITNRLMTDRLSKEDIKSGVILDGYPRCIEQVYALNEISKDLSINIDYAIYLKVNYETALKRTIGRRICPECKMTYNVLTGFNAPLVNETCNFCHIPLTKRNDDNEESLKVRFDFFNENTMPVVNYYRECGKLIELDATQNTDKILKNLEDALRVKND